MMTRVWISRLMLMLMISPLACVPGAEILRRDQPGYREVLLHGGGHAPGLGPGGRRDAHRLGEPRDHEVRAASMLRLYKYTL
jgi:hypothetical protein